MKVEFLGTGGAIATPRPLCDCRVCREAREKGVPYSRGGPSVFVHGPDVLVDTPEEIRLLLDRSRVTNISACVYSHWHPDHVMGRRVFESLNWDLKNWPPKSRRTDVYLPEGVGRDFRERLGSWEHLKYLERLGLVNVVEVPDGKAFEVGEALITPLRLAEGFVYGFLFEGGGKRLLVVMDELKGWEPPERARGVDLAVLPKGVTEFDPISGERRIPKESPILRLETTFEETLEIAGKLGAGRVVLSHVEEFSGLGYGDLLAVERNLRAEGANIAFAHDTLTVDV